MSFNKHPSRSLTTLFQEKPYQGQAPEKARIIFLSSDANYSEDISNSSFFDRILEYHADGVCFWKTHGKHHPFLLNDYPFDKRKDGVVFHRNFSKLNLGSQDASNISFIELLDVPTIGIKSKNKVKFMDLVSLSHIQYLDNFIENNQGKLILVPSGVLHDMMQIKKRYPVFKWLNYSKTNHKYQQRFSNGELKEICHFSSSQIHAFIPILQEYISQYRLRGD
ncbi:hypothetical protein [Undibacterium flavidum]|uniref:Uncharacterized protein n=1 Tax=Undibacterium flavidum TaxID=2762297 RepID=A0ABR6Y7V8_9BURK|nr:hypothetical protein [Undibacterium flavidum]MBC3872670.1 hypothetical protein [Undibacterium flavidum]